MKNEKIITLNKNDFGNGRSIWIIDECTEFCDALIAEYIPATKNMTYMELRITTTRPSGDNFFILICEHPGDTWAFTEMEPLYNFASPWDFEFDDLLTDLFPDDLKIFVRIYGY